MSHTHTVWGELVAAEWDRDRYVKRVDALTVRYDRLLRLTRSSDAREQAKLRLELIREHPSALREAVEANRVAGRIAEVRTERSSLQAGAPLPPPPERDARVRVLSLADFTWMIRELRKVRSMSRRTPLEAAWSDYVAEHPDPLPSVELANAMLSTPRSHILRAGLATCSARYQRSDLAGLWAPAGPKPPEQTIDLVQIGPVSAIREGRPKRIDAFGRVIAVFRHEGQLCALDDTCPHRGGPLGKGDVEDGAVHCPLHGWAFDLKTGVMRGNDRMRVQTYEVVEVDGDATLKLKG